MPQIVRVWVALLLLIVFHSADAESLGPSSRRTGLAISEVMYHPAPRDDGRLLEFIEIYNSQAISEDLSGYRISGDADYRFPAGTVLAAGAFLVVARSPADVQAVYSITNVVGPFTNNLPNGSGVVRLRNELDAVLLDVQYESRAQWPVAADGTGHSLVLARPSYGEGDPRAWGINDVVGGSPGAANPVTVDSLRGVVINELLANTDPPLEDYLELYNDSSETRDISGAWLSDEATTNKFRIPDGVMLPPGGFVHFTQSTLGFALSSDGERVFLMNSNRTRVLDAIAFEAQANGVAFGRVPDGGGRFHRLLERTPGTANTDAHRATVVINEIMYNPISGLDDDQYVEVHNRGGTAMDISGWRLTDGIEFRFPANTVLAAGGHLVVAKNAGRLRTNYAHLNTVNCLGDFSGRLSHGGERLALAILELPTNYVVVSEVTYVDGGRWGDWSDGGGSSLELKDPRADPSLAANWGDSELVPGPWTTVEYIGPIGPTIFGTSTGPINNNLHIYLLGQGECLVDDVEVRTNNLPNEITNPGFESGLSGWTVQGAYDQSTAEAGGFSGSQCLRVRGSTRGDPGANKIRSPAFGPIATNVPMSVTLRCKARWLRGSPELLLRMHGGGIEAYGRLPTSGNLGSPGLQNSRFVGNAGPAVFEVAHAPVLPAANQAVTVRAQVDDPEGAASVILRYRIDPSVTFTEVTMTADSTGRFNGTIPGQPNGALVAFHVWAVDGLGATNTFPQRIFPSGAAPRVFPRDAVSHECLVRFGEPQMAGAFATYHLWITEQNRNRWRDRDRLNNADVDVTFVYNDERAVYNAGAQYSGSPFHRGNMTAGPDGASRCDYIVHMPEEDRVLGDTDFNLVLPGNTSSTTETHDKSGFAEQIAYLIFRKMGIPHTYRRHIHMFVNGTRRSSTASLPIFVLEDAQQPNSDFIEQWFPDDPEGQLIKLEDWIEYNDDASNFNRESSQVRAGGQLIRMLVPGTTNFNIAPYRYWWRLRAVGAGESANDYTHLFNLVDALSPTTVENAPVNYPLVNDLMDVHQWFREIACQRTVCNQDSYGWAGGKNNYAYRPTNGRYVLMPWDTDWVFDQGASQPPTSSIYGSAGHQNCDPRALALMQVPVVLRDYLQTFIEILNGPLRLGFLEGKMDERAAAFAANGINYDPANITAIKNFLVARRTHMLGELAAMHTNFVVIGSTNISVSSNLVTITGRAPLEVAQITVNGRPWQVTWVTSNMWSLTLALESGANTLEIAGFTRNSTPVSNATTQVNVNVSAVNDSPIGNVIFNELLYNAPVRNGEFVELLNLSPRTAFDLSGWRINGLDYRFPSGTVLAPGAFLVVTEDRHAFARSFGASLPMFGEFEGQLDRDGETLTLFMPGAQPGEEIVVDRVRYEAEAPWPVQATKSLQLIDAQNDNSRVGNWGLGPEWKYVSFTGTAGASRLFVFLNGIGDVFIDDIVLVQGSVPEAGPNLVRNGDFEAPLSGTWIVPASNARTHLSATNVHAGNGSLHLVTTNPAVTVQGALSQDITPPLMSGQTYTLSYWYRPVPYNPSLTLRFGSGTLNSTHPMASVYFTPGASNANAKSLPAFPPLWLNEVQPSDSAWIELYNSGAAPVSLNGLYLNGHAFPAGTTAAAGEFLVISNTSVAPTNGSVLLTRLIEGQSQVVDYLNYRGVVMQRSYGDFPNGQPFFREVFQMPTPGAANSDAVAPIQVKINEWMAANSGAVADPADGDFDDWVELYNPAPEDVSLAGCFLTDTLLNWTKWQFPAYAVIPGGGFLLIWCDEEGSQNSSNGMRLHANFKLSAAGEEIGLFASDGTQIDAVTFGSQTDNRTQGRSPDGSAQIVLLPQISAGSPNFQLSPPTVTITWSAPNVFINVGTTPGLTCQVEFKDDLADNWTPLIPPFTASAASHTIIDSVAASPQRFYRVRMSF